MAQSPLKSHFFHSEFTLSFIDALHYLLGLTRLSLICSHFGIFDAFVFTKRAHEGEMRKS